MKNENVNQFFEHLLSDVLRGGNLGFSSKKLPINLLGKFENNNLDAQNLLRTYFSGVSYDDKGQERTRKKICKIAKNVKIESGFVLASIFTDILINREKIKTELLDGEKMKEFSIDPYDIDYGILPDNIQDFFQDMLEKEEPKQVIFSVATKNSDQFECQKCKGKGFLKCNRCNGSGRESYVDGYYANGNERIKTGQCSNCFGTGTIQCDACFGSGKQQFSSDKTQVIKKFADIKKVNSAIYFSDTFGNVSTSDYYDLGYSNSERRSSFWYYLIEDLDNQDFKSGISKLYKNEKELLIDNQSVPDNIIDEFKSEYKDLKKYRLSRQKEELKENKLVCSIEKHLVIPALCLSFVANIDGERDYRITIFELNGTVFSNNLYFFRELGFFKSLFI